MRPGDNSSSVGFPVSREARDRYQFDQALFAPTGKAAIETFHAARLFAQQMNLKRNLAAFPEMTIPAGQINAMALVHGISQYLFRLYCEQHPGVLKDALDRLQQQIGPARTDQMLDRFIDQFPPMAVYLRELQRGQYLARATAGKSNREIALEELLMLWLSNSNPAFGPFLELFDDALLEYQTAYKQAIDRLYQYFGKVAEQDAVQKTSFTSGQNIIDFLLAPARAVPHSLEGQIAYLLERWGALIGPYAYRLLRGLDLIKEEYRPVFAGPGPSVVPVFDSAPFEAERFSPDRDWMPNLVLIAKNAYVWMDQLSKKYSRPITRLDQIPDAELEKLARWGITGLWLIGLWERSKASQTIKQLCGNPEAVASAYSLYDYQIAADLGGEAACADLRQRAWQRGVRLASDMVPNHVGIDGRWVMEHPDWFISLDYSPFPGYTFNGPDLSRDERVGIFLEDHYYTRSDAAVVFKRVDRWTGSTRYIYHGNDGTSMPWNDTAQLNYLNPEMREAMIQTILHVARQFPVIRFDAAMTMVKRHIQRLWFPEPGSGGAIPSRAEHGITRAQFEAAMPEEFWREVVDRVAAEVPDTLLLAEAFWLMEGYFVRTLGMHRVYNSAFMNMLRDEDNAKYRSVMKNTLEFDPEVLKRYVNFMNNPDERTAVDQFGKDDKYFGVCTLMVTMPGLPMIGHGQIEGFTEKYGMEYRRAYWDESVDQGLVQRHEREIFPLCRKRYLFAQVEDFLLYDFYSPDGTVNEDVYAYSNAAGDERSLVIYHNRYATARGWIRTSAAYSVKTGSGDERRLVQRNLGQGLGLQPDGNQFCIFQDYGSGLEYIRNSRELYEQGLYVELGAYQYHVFLNFRTVVDDATGQYSHLASFLAGRGVSSIQEALQEIYVRPIREPFQALVNPELYRRLMESREEDEAPDAELLDEVEQKLITLLNAIQEFTPDGPDRLIPEEDRTEAIARKVRNDLEAVLQLPMPELLTAAPGAFRTVREALEGNLALWGGLLSWVFVHALGEIGGDPDSAERSRSWIDEWLLGKIIRATLQGLGVDEATAAHTLTAVKFATSHQSILRGHTKEHADIILGALLQDGDVQQFLGVNRYRDILWFNKENFEQLLVWMLLLAAITSSGKTGRSGPEEIVARYTVVKQLRQAASASEYQVEKLRAAITKTKRAQPVGAGQGRRSGPKRR